MNYLSQLEKAVIFIENNLKEDLKVEEIARYAGYSYFHFHRIFEALVGEPVGNYLRSRRLAQAAYDLSYTNKRIIDIAVEYRFESQEAFSRAFKKVYHKSPGAFRKSRMDIILGNRKPLTFSSLMHLKNGITIVPQIVETKDVKIVGIRGSTTLKQNMIPQLWEKFNLKVSEIKNRVPNFRGYGICEVDPAFDMLFFSENTQYCEFVGIEVLDFKDIPGGMETKLLKGGKYAVFTHKGSLKTLNLTYDYIWGTWISCSGYEMDMRDDYERYDERFLGPDNNQSEIDIYFPIK
ncbi:MAG: GyrI-like domain-containing protein [Clostridia bacterium]|nr:GyrI-like domain-containing protein [Clostridia bacterium]